MDNNITENLQSELDEVRRILQEIVYQACDLNNHRHNTLPEALQDAKDFLKETKPISSDTWYRCRFHADLDDYRPVAWPPPGPFWCSGTGDDYSVIIAYVTSEEQVIEFWPEANNISAEECDEIVFTDRFPEPEWWKENKTI